MPTFPVRRLGSTGIVTDAHPADIEDVGTFTYGVNVRFKNGRATRGPVCRTISAIPHEPGHLFSIPPGASGYDEIISVSEDFGSLQRLNGSNWEDVTPPDHEATTGNQPITSSYLGGVAYVNRETHAPLCKSPGDSAFVQLPNWAPDDRTRVLRPYKDQLIALGVTKQGAYYPTMVKWSDFAYYGAPPGSWDPTLTTNSAGENIVNEMQQGIVDGLGLRDSFVIYCAASVWLMDYIGGNDIYAFRKLYDEVGAIGANCVVQVGAMHYVFDRNDIYVHDGVTPKSIADGRVKEFIFDALDFSKVGLCFVQHDANLTEVRFAYPASDKSSTVPITGCNRQAVFNYSNDTWTFYDVPNVVSSTKAAIIEGDDWDTDLEVTFDEAEGLWMSSEGDEDRHCLIAGRSDPARGLMAPRLYGQDLLDGGRLTQPVEPEVLKPSVMERVGIDLDYQGKNLTQYMNLQAIYPQMSAAVPTDCYWQFGASDRVNEDPVWSLPATFDPNTETKIDINEAGKYLGYRFTCGGLGSFQLSSFDVQLIVRGRR